MHAYKDEKQAITGLPCTRQVNIWKVNTILQNYGRAKESQNIVEPREIKHVELIWKMYI